MNMSEEKNNEVFLRPRFKIDSDKNEAELMNRFMGNLNSGDCKYCSKIVDNHIFIDVPPDQDHFWSPSNSKGFVRPKATSMDLVYVSSFCNWNIVFSFFNDVICSMDAKCKFGVFSHYGNYFTNYLGRIICSRSNGKEEGKTTNGRIT